jgi:hypothetical protein
VDQQANRRARFAPGATLNPGRLNGSQGVTTFLKVTVNLLAAYAQSSELQSRNNAASMQHLHKAKSANLHSQAVA